MAVSAAEAAVAGGWRADAPRVAPFASQLSSTVLLTYAQLLFSRSRTVGALLLVATLASPSRGLVGLGAVGVSLATASALRLPPEQVRAGQHSYNALMAGLCLAALAPPSPHALAVVALAAAASVLLSAALHVAIGVGHGLPVLTLPFLAVGWLGVGVLPAGAHHATTDGFGAGLAPDYLRALGSLLCAPDVRAGALVLAALLAHSRIAAALSVVAFALAWFASPTQGLNCLLVAVALGGVWFVPSASSYALALGGAAVCALMGLGLAPRFERLGLPLWILPFNLTVPLVLMVMRQRVADGRPHAVDFTPGTPEQNLAYFRSRRERFGAASGVRLSPPFRGRWTCSQGVSGGVTHEGPWRHALDFVVCDAEGREHRGAGDGLDDYGCYRLPVVAPAAGVVVRVVDGVRDNPVGEVNLDAPWGNAVVVRHATGVHSCVAHLSPGTIAVREGQAVVAGETLGRCGNSGRSATPHLHLQLQGLADVGAATLPLALHDAVVAGELRSESIPAKGDEVRAVDRDDERAALLCFAYGVALRVSVEGGGHETLVADIDLLGRQLLRSVERDAALYYEHSPAGLTVHDVVGDPGSALHLLRYALSRVPFDADDALRWSDRLPIRAFLPVWARPLYDVVSPFGGPSSLALRYAFRRHGRSLLIEGASERRTRDGRPWVATSACLAPRAGYLRLDVTVRGRRTRLWVEPAINPHHEPSPLPLAGGLAHDQR